MLFLKEIHCVNFKNLTDFRTELSPEINLLVGNNGSGKTSLLDAVHYLCLTKSFLSAQDGFSIQYNQDFCLIEGWFERNEQSEWIQLRLHRDQKKVVKRNEKAYERLQEHVGLFPVVVISPYDTDLIHLSSEHRRRFIDQLISQLHPDYLDALIHYNKTLLQRNALLKSSMGGENVDDITLEALNQPLMKYGTILYNYRKSYVQEIHKELTHYYRELGESGEQVAVQYATQWDDNPIQILSQSLSNDLRLGFTTKGTHRDDLEFLFQGQPLKKVGSQGQQKSFLIALKLAQQKILQQKLQQHPLLLLDDIFDKLDPNRVQRLIHLVNDTHFGQVFITHTHEQVIKEIVKNTGRNFKEIHL